MKALSCGSYLQFVTSMSVFRDLKVLLKLLLQGLIGSFACSSRLKVKHKTVLVLVFCFAIWIVWNMIKAGFLGTFGGSLIFYWERQVNFSFVCVFIFTYLFMYLLFFPWPCSLTNKVYLYSISWCYGTNGNLGLNTFLHDYLAVLEIGSPSEGRALFLSISRLAPWWWVVLIYPC